MTPEHDKALRDRYALIFRATKKSGAPFAVWGFECPDGWYTLLDALCSTLCAAYEAERSRHEGLLRSGGTAKAIEAARLRLLAAKKQVPVVRQVKSKFGGLRFYVRGGTDAHHACVQFAEALSLSTCEVCGAPGTRRTAGWIQTLCDVHDAEFRAASEAASRSDD